MHERGEQCEHLKRLLTRFDTGAEISANPRYLDYVLDTLDLRHANTAPTLGAPSRKRLCAAPQTSTWLEAAPT